MVITNSPVGVCLAFVAMVRVEEAPPLPGVTLAGENEQVASAGNPEHDRPTGLEKAPPTEPSVMVKDTELPLRTDTLLGEAAMEKSTPVPVRVTCWGLPDALSTNCRIPVRAPAAVGLKDTFTVQAEPGASEDGQLFV